MPKYFITVVIILFPLLCITAFTIKEKKQANHGFAVIELFTSEGCSSCPPADEAVRDVANRFKDNVFILAFHVDYWNYLGWKDVFSKADYSNRQKQYASVFSLNSIYTPQIIVNGETEFVGSDKNKLEAAIKNELSKNDARSIKISAKEKADHKISINSETNVAENASINFALVQLNASSNVSKGENEGKLLHHINIVRDFKSIAGGSKENNIYFDIPSGLSKKELGIIAFVQNKSTLKIETAASTSIE